jgi:hypothetical protein
MQSKQVNKLVDRDLSAISTLVALHERRLALKNKLQARVEYMSSAEGIISGLFFTSKYKNLQYRSSFIDLTDSELAGMAGLFQRHVLDSICLSRTQDDQEP